MGSEKQMKAQISAKGMQIAVVSVGSYDDYISLTDIARYKSEDPSATIQNWMRNRDVIEFLGLWETIHNADFKPLEFEGFRQKSGYNAFTLSPKRWQIQRQLLEFIQKPVDTVVPMYIAILHLSLHLGFQRSLNCISLLIISASRTMKTVGFLLIGT